MLFWCSSICPLIWGPWSRPERSWRKGSSSGRWSDGWFRFYKESTRVTAIVLYTGIWSLLICWFLMRGFSRLRILVRYDQYWSFFLLFDFSFLGLCLFWILLTRYLPPELDSCILYVFVYSVAKCSGLPFLVLELYLLIILFEKFVAVFLYRLICARAWYR